MPSSTQERFHARKSAAPSHFWAGAALLLCLIAPAYADGLPGDVSLKDPIPDNLTWKGVTVYGTVDIGYAYQTHGAPLSGAAYTGLQDNINGSKDAHGPISSLNDGGLEQSKIGVNIEEPIGYGWTAIAKLEAGFNPLSGEIADACASLVRNNGKALTAQDTNYDGSRCGQVFSGPAYGGVSNPFFGTVTVGRQQSLELDAIGNYDPMGLSYAFSLIGYSGGTAAGSGDTETGRWDNAIKYVYQLGPVHAAGIYSDGGQDTAMFGGGYGFNLGGEWRGFAIDAVYTRDRGAVSSASLTSAQILAGANPSTLAGTITDDEAWSVMGKYTFDFAAGLKDEGPGAKLTFFAGYVHMDLANPQNAVLANSTTIGGYVLSVINNQPYAIGSDKILQTTWAGAKYELRSGWSFSGTYYRLGQDAYMAYAKNAGQVLVNQNCTAMTATNVASKAAGKYAGITTGSNCSGDLNQGSFLIDYRFNKHLDVYAGVSYSSVDDGLSSGYLNDNTTFFMTGARLKF